MVFLFFRTVKQTGPHEGVCAMIGLQNKKWVASSIRMLKIYN